MTGEIIHQFADHHHHLNNKPRESLLDKKNVYQNMMGSDPTSVENAAHMLLKNGAKFSTV